MKRMEARFAAAIAAVTMLVSGGCTTRLSVTPLASTGATPVGVPFPLYFDQFRLSVNYQLVKCDKEILFKTTVDIAERIRVPDPVHSYVIDPNSLAAFNKTAEASVKYFPNGMPSAINAKADDRTAEIAGSLVKSAAGIAKLAAGAAGVSATVACSPEGTKALKALADAAASVKARGADLDKAQAAFDRRKAQVDAAGPALPSNLRQQFARDFMALQTALQALESARKAHEAAKKPLTFSVAHSWPENGNMMDEKGVPIIKEIAPAIAQLTPLLDKLIKGGSAAASLNPADMGKLAVRLEIKADQPESPYVAKAGSTTVAKADLDKGIPYRNPQSGQFVVQVKNDQNIWETAETKRYDFLQLGRVFILPCVSKPFTTISCNLAFNENGRVSEAGTVNSKAPGEAMAGLLATAVTEAGGLKSALDGKALKDKQDELALLEVENKIKAARAVQATTLTQKQQWEEEIAMLDTERRVIEARRSLAESRAKVDP